MDDIDLSAGLLPESPKPRRGGINRDRVLQIARSDNIPDDIADDFAKVMSFESGGSHFDRRGKVKLSPPDPKTGERAVGATQIKPSTARGVGVDDPFDEDKNLLAGLRYFRSGGTDPAGRRIHYFGGPKALQRYQRTGKIPKGKDVLGTTFEQYVKSTGGEQKQKPKIDLSAGFEDNLASGLEDSGQIPPPSSELKTADKPAKSPVTPASRQSVPKYSFSGRAFGELADSQQRAAVEQAVKDIERKPRLPEVIDAGNAVEVDPETMRPIAESLDKRIRGSADFKGEEYKNFLLMNRSLDSPNQREAFIKLKTKQAIAAAGSPASAVAEQQRQERVAQTPTSEKLKQAGKSAALGLAQSAETGLKSIAILAKKIDFTGEYEGKKASDLATYQAGEYISKRAREILQSNPDLEQDFLVGKTPQAVGQAVSFLLGGVATKAPKLTVTILGAGMTAGEAYDEVRAAGGTDDEAVNAGLLAGAILGPTELIGMRGAMKAIAGTAREATLKAALKTALREGRRDVIENALQEAGQEFGQGLITGQHRSPSQILEAAALGGIASGVVTPTVTLATQAGGRRGTQTQTAPDTAIPAPVLESGQPAPVSPPAGATTEAPSSPQRFYHKDFGEVEILADQTGAGKNRYRVAEVADPTKQHFVKKSYLTGRGNERMVPIKAGPAVETLNLEVGLVDAPKLEPTVESTVSPEQTAAEPLRLNETTAQESGLGQLPELQVPTRPVTATATTAAGFKPDLSLSQFVRKMGGIVPSEMHRGEIDRLRLRDSGTTGLINQQARQGNVKQTADIMMQTANDAGYRDPNTGRPFENPGDFLHAVERDVLGDKIRVSSGTEDFSAAEAEYYAEQESRARAEEARNTFLESGRGAELFDRIVDRKASDAERQEYIDLAERAGISRAESEDLIADARAEIEALQGDGREGTQPASRPAEQLGFVQEGLTQQEAPPPKTTDQREQLIREEQDRQAQLNPERTAALAKLEEIKRRGMTVDDYARQPDLMGNVPSAEEVARLRALETNPNAVAPARTPSRQIPIWEMSRSELERAAEAEQSDEYAHLLKFFSKAGARRFQQLNQERLSARSNVQATRAEAQMNELLSGLSSKEQQRLDDWYKESESRPSSDDYRHHLRNLEDIDGSSDSEQSMANLLARILPRIRSEEQMARQLPTAQLDARLAQAELREAARVAREAGLDPVSLEKLTIRAAGERYGPDLNFMLREFFSVKEQAAKTGAESERNNPRQLSAPATADIELRIDRLLGEFSTEGFLKSEEGGFDLTRLRRVYQQLRGQQETLPDGVEFAGERYHELTSELLRLNLAISDSGRPDSKVSKAEVEAMWRRHRELVSRTTDLERYLQGKGYKVNLLGEVVKKDKRFPSALKARPLSEKIKDFFRGEGGALDLQKLRERMRQLLQNDPGITDEELVAAVQKDIGNLQVEPTAKARQNFGPGTMRAGEPLPEVKERKFGKRFTEDERIADEIRSEIGTAKYYEPIPNKLTAEQARSLVEQRGIGESIRIIRDEKNDLAPHLRSTMGQIVMLKLNQTYRNLKAAGSEKADGVLEQAVDLAEWAMDYGTRLGQGVQSFAMWSRLTPEGMLLQYKRAVKKARERHQKLFGEDVAEIVKKVNEAKTDEERVEALKNLFKTNKTAKKVKSDFDKILEAAKTRMLTDNLFYEIVGDKLGLPGYNRETAQKITDLANRIEAAPEGLPRTKLVLELQKFIAEQKGFDVADLPLGIFYGNILSGYNTHAVNFADTGLNVLSEINGLALNNPQAAAKIYAGMLRGFAEGRWDAMLALTEGRMFRDSKWLDAPGLMEVAKFGQKGGVPIKTETRVGRFAKRAAESKIATPLNAYKYVSRAMSASDAVMARSASEARSTLLAYKMAKDEGLKGDALEARVREILALDRQADFMAQAEREGFTGKEAAFRANELREMARPKDLTADAAEFAGEATYNHKPHGTLGLIAERVGKLSEDVKPLKLFVPFTRIVANVTNRGLNYTPYGYKRAVMGWGFGKNVEPLTAEARRLMLTRATVGTAGMVLLGALQQAGVIAIHGNGPSDREKRRQLQNAGWRPYSLQIGKTYVSYVNSPVGLGLSILGNMTDADRYHELQQKDAATRGAYAVARLGSTIFSQSFLSGLSRLFSALSDRPEVSVTAVKQTLGGTVAAFGVPNIARDLHRLFDNKAYQSNTLMEDLIRNTPFAALALRPSLDAFGEPVKLQRQRFFDIQSSDPAWRFVIEKGLRVPVPGRTIEMEKGRRITPEEYYELLKTTGPKVKEWIIKNRVRLSKMKEQDAQDELSEAAARIRKFELVKMKMRVRRKAA